MLIDSFELPTNQEIDATVCIVGAGAAGITLARVLGAAGLDVCLLESGGLEPEETVQDLHKGRNVGLPYFDLDACRLRYFGGTTNHWAGYCWRFRPEDFTVRDWLPHSGWPIDHNDVYRFDEQVHEILDIAPFDFSTSHWLETFGRPDFLIQEPDIGTEIVRFSPPTRFGPKYQAELTRSDRIKLYLNANVIEIETDATTQSVTRLAAQCLDGKRFSVRARAYILAAGGIENPRLLLASNRQAAAGLANGHDQVGRYFMDHPNLWSAAEIALSRENPDGGLYFTRFDAKDRYLTRARLSLPVETLERDGLLGTSFFLEPSYRSKGVESLKSLARSPADMDRHIPNIARDLDAVFDVLYKNATGAKDGPFDAEGDLVALDVRPSLEQAPNPDSRVRLGQTRDALGLPQVELDWRLTASDKRSLRRALEILGLAVGRSGLGRLKSKIEDSDDPDSWPADMEGSNHHIGTTRMSDAPQTGVVDRNCRVHGMENLYLAGSSVFTTSGANPPTYTIVALALRLAEHLRDRLD